MTQLLSAMNSAQMHQQTLHWWSSQMQSSREEWAGKESAWLQQGDGAACLISVSREMCGVFDVHQCSRQSQIVRGAREQNILPVRCLHLDLIILFIFLVKVSSVDLIIGTTWQHLSRTFPIGIRTMTHGISTFNYIWILQSNNNEGQHLFFQYYHRHQQPTQNLCLS